MDKQFKIDLAKSDYEVWRFSEIAEKIRNLAHGGGFTTPDSYYLFRYAEKIPNGGAYLEIGSWLGGSLMCTFLGTQSSGTSVNFIAIEPAISQRFLDNIKLIPNLKIIRSTSNDAQDKIAESSIDLLFIDGDHRYQQAKRDLENYWPKIKAGGILIGHDYATRGIVGVKQAADEKFGKRVIFLKGSWSYMVQKSTTDS